MATGMFGHGIALGSGRDDWFLSRLLLLHRLLWDRLGLRLQHIEEEFVDGKHGAASVHVDLVVDQGH